ncbi:two-partner secretion domain-containing protein [Leptolyngbya sp. NIES-2104]|uniref:two-partner secretion domain-containing protein n=1 Tax=Leptolyngbya sp. NIES-2104 TaxID=1552121 RepID=UPI0006ECC4F5|nr:filamentous hemagglutinin N-terminal domain-containing protein [Leptolyngbya sp. NIES-2104]GAP98750.1 putative hemagglutinin-related protein [Leptolyngbya sp. NIES-2104]
MNRSKLRDILLRNSGIALFALTQPAIAQVIPDATLPNPSVVETQGTRSSIIQGTEINGNLFHSFREFSIPTGSSVLFDNATGIRNIFTRVTGGNISSIDGLIQANGTANLFLLNPNGILFGANARLNIGGSFTASTGDRLVFDNGEFSATNPEAPPLLTISAPVGLGTPRTGSTIANQGQLTVPGSFTLHADQLQVDGQINAGNDLILRSNNAISSNAQFNTGSNFWIEDFNGGLGTLISSGGSRIRSLGDVNFGSYQGASLQILAGGSISIPNGIQINNSGSGSVENVTLSDGSNVAIGLQAEPTIDIRAGVKPEILNLNGNATPTRADIQIGRISIADSFGNSRIGSTLITNQFEPNLVLPGDINLTGGISAIAIFANGLNLAIDSRNHVNFNNILLGFSIYENGGNTKILAQGDVYVPYIDNASNFKNGGNITIDAGGTLNLLEGVITGGRQDGGNVQLSATGDIELGSIQTLSGFGSAGSVQINSRGGAINAGNVSAFADLSGRNGSSVTLNAAGDINVQNVGTSGGFAGNSSGEIQITSQNGNIYLTDGTLFSAKFGSGTSGDIRLNAGQNVEINQGDVTSSIIFGSGGRAGDLSIRAGNSIFLNQTALSSSTGLESLAISHSYGLRQLSFGDRSFYPGFGNAGNIRLNAGRDIVGRDSAVYSTVVDTSVGNAGRLEMTAGNTVIWQRNPGRFGYPGLYAFSRGQGNAGDITIDANSLSLFGAGIETGVSFQAIGESGNITINLRDNLLMNGGADWYSLISTQVKPSGFPVEALGTKGNITIHAGSITMRNRGEISSGVGDTNGGRFAETILAKGNGGNIDLNVQGDIDLDTSSISSQVFANGSGTAGKIEIDARSIFMRRSAIASGVAGEGGANTIQITAQEAITLDLSDITSAVQPAAIGRGQDIVLTAPSIRLSNGAQINTLTSGNGDAGNVFVNADTLTIAGVNLEGFPVALFRAPPPYSFGSDISTTAPPFVGGTQSGIFSSTNTRASGGNIRITVQSLTVRDGAELDAITTRRNGQGGVIQITANQVNLLDGGRLSVSSTAQGAAGTIQINTDQIQIRGDDPFFLARAEKFNPTAIDFYGKPRRGSQSVSGIFASTSPGSSGTGGTIAIDTGDLKISDNGRISVDSQGTGDGGRIRIDAGDVLLDRGNIVAKTESGEGGNISLTAQNLLRLRRNSQISATANGTGNGGNIDVTANGFIVAVPNENSDITANAVRGRGGNIQLTTQGIFGISPSAALTELSDITASSEFGLDGTVKLTTLQPEPREQVQEIPQLVDTSNQIAQTCSPRSRANSFVVTGKGGLPPDPTEALNTTEIWNNSGTAIASTLPESSEVIEATHWVKNADGSIALVAEKTVQPTVPTCEGVKP